MAGIDEITRLLDNFYKRIFEQSPYRQNRVLSNAQVLNDSMSAMTDTGPSTEIPVTARYYSDLTLAGTDQDADASIFKIQTTTGRLQYGAGVLDETSLTLVFRVRPDAASGLLAAGHLFRWGAGASDFLSCRWDGAGAWQIQRSATGGAAAQSQTAADTFSSGNAVTVAFKFTATTIGISIDGGAFSMGGGSADIPVLSDALFDLLSNQGASEWFNGGVFWCLITPSELTDAQIAAIHATGDTDPEWNGAILNGINLSFLWHCDSSTVHEAMSNRYGESQYG